MPLATCCRSLAKEADCDAGALKHGKKSTLRRDSSFLCAESMQDNDSYTGFGKESGGTEMDANRQVFPIHLCGKCNMEWKFNLAVTITSYLSLVVRQQIVGTRTEQVHTDLLVSWMHMLPQTKNFTDRQHQDGSLHRKQAIRLAYGLSRTSSAWLE